MISGIKCALFDFDGTLASNCHHVCHCYRNVQMQLGLTPASFEYLMDIQGLSFEDTRDVLQCPPELADKFAELFWIEMADFEKPGYQAFLLPYVAETLKALKHKNIPVGVVTANHSTIVKRCSTLLGIDQYIDFYLGSDICDEAKPSAKPLLACMDKLTNGKVTPAQTIYVGDSKTDLMAGLNTKVMKTFVIIPNNHFERRFAEDIKMGLLPEIGKRWVHFESMESLVKLVKEN